MTMDHSYKESNSTVHERTKEKNAEQKRKS